MMNIGACGLIAVVIATGLQGSPREAMPKETVKLTLSGPGFSQPLEITDPPVLALSHVYMGAFIGAPAIDPDPAWPRYAVTFTIHTRDHADKAYVVSYSRDRWTGDGFLYLPGPGEEFYRLNVSTILRDGQDGRWHHASEAWSHAIQSYLPY